MEFPGNTQIVVPLPSTALYDYLSDFTRHPEWSANLQRVTQVTPGQVGVGTRFRTDEGPPPVAPLRRLASMVFFVAGLLRGATHYSEAEITALDPGRRIAWTGRVVRRGAVVVFNRADWEFVLEPQGDATRLTQRFVYRPGTASAERMIHALGDAPGIETAVAANLARLKAVVKRRTDVPMAAVAE